jgi:hypothetical protein
VIRESSVLAPTIEVLRKKPPLKCPYPEVEIERAPPGASLGTPASTEAARIVSAAAGVAPRQSPGY